MLNDQRKKQTARVRRYMRPIEHVITNTLFGKSELLKYPCSYHHVMHPGDQYYWIKTIYGWRPRPMCIEAWDLTNGKLPDENRTPSPELPFDFSEEGGRAKPITKKKRMSRNRPCLTTRWLVFEDEEV